MPFYETVFMARPDLTEAQVKDLTKHFTKVLTDQGGKITKNEYWGLRTLAYRINKSRKAHYVLLECEAPGQAPAELERQLRIHEDVIRSLTTRLDEPTKGPSPIMDKSGSNDDYRPSRSDRSESSDNSKEAA